MGIIMALLRRISSYRLASSSSGDLPVFHLTLLKPGIIVDSMGIHDSQTNLTLLQQQVLRLQTFH